MCNEITRRRYVNNTSGSRGALGNCGLTKTLSKTKLPAQKIIAVKSEKLLWLRNRLHLLPFASSLFLTQWKFRGNTHAQGLIFPFARQSSGSHCKKTKKKKKLLFLVFVKFFMTVENWREKFVRKWMWRLVKKGPEINSDYSTLELTEQVKISSSE